jgi:hypothetical protein
MDESINNKNKKNTSELSTHNKLTNYFTCSEKKIKLLLYQLSSAL